MISVLSSDRKLIPFLEDVLQEKCMALKLSSLIPFSFQWPQREELGCRLWGSDGAGLEVLGIMEPGRLDRIQMKPLKGNFAADKNTHPHAHPPHIQFPVSYFSPGLI